MRALLLLLGSVGGFLALARRSRKRSAEVAGTALAAEDDRLTPVSIGDGSLWLSSPGIDNGQDWERTDRHVRSKFGHSEIVRSHLIVNGRAADGPSLEGERVITVVYDGASVMTIATPESDAGHVNILWHDASGDGFGQGGAWRPDGDRLTYSSANNEARITRILVDGEAWYRAKDFDKGSHRASCELRLVYRRGRP